MIYSIKLVGAGGEGKTNIREMDKVQKVDILYNMRFILRQISSYSRRV